MLTALALSGCDRAMLFVVRKPCDSASVLATPLLRPPSLCESHGPATLDHPLPQTFSNFDQQPPRIYCGKCLVRHEQLPDLIFPCGQLPAPVINGLPTADSSFPLLNQLRPKI
jgi:hypothetical protein